MTSKILFLSAYAILFSSNMLLSADNSISYYHSRIRENNNSGHGFSFSRNCVNLYKKLDLTITLKASRFERSNELKSDFDVLPFKVKTMWGDEKTTRYEASPAFGYQIKFLRIYAGFEYGYEIFQQFNTGFRRNFDYAPKNGLGVNINVLYNSVPKDLKSKSHYFSTLIGFKIDIFPFFSIFWEYEKSNMYHKKNDIFFDSIINRTSNINLGLSANF